MWFLILIISMLAIFYLIELKSRQKAPPGPWPIPFLGNLPQYLPLANDPRLFIYKQSQKYGEISRFRMGFRDIIFVSSWESYCQLFTESIGRPRVEIFSERNFNKVTGINLTTGDHWSETRNWTMKTLRNFGFYDRNNTEPKILEEVDVLLKQIGNVVDANGEGIVDMHQFFATPVTKVMWRMIVGRWNLGDDILLNKVVHSSYTFMSQGLLGPGLLNAFPFLKHIFPEALGLNLTMEQTKITREIARNLLEEGHKAMEKKTKPESFMEAFAMEMKSRKINNQEKTALNIFTTFNMETIFMDILQGSSDPANSLLERIILYMALYPEVQSKIFQEIQNTFQPGEKITFASHKLMKYTQAFFMEIDRYVPVIQQNVRKMEKDVYYKGYFIPKGSDLTSDLVAIYKNLKVWGDDPDEFRPERFFNKNGELYNQQYLSPFGIGKRACPGKNMGEMVTFLFFISIVKHYEVSLVPGDKRPEEFPIIGVITLTKPYRVIFSKRV